MSVVENNINIVIALWLTGGYAFSLDIPNSDHDPFYIWIITTHFQQTFFFIEIKFACIHTFSERIAYQKI